MFVLFAVRVCIGQSTPVADVAQLRLRMVKAGLVVHICLRAVQVSCVMRTASD